MTMVGFDDLCLYIVHTTCGATFWSVEVKGAWIHCCMYRFPVRGHSELPNATLISHVGILIAIMPYLCVIATPNIITTIWHPSF